MRIVLAAVHGLEQGPGQVPAPRRFMALILTAKALSGSHVCAVDMVSTSAEAQAQMVSNLENGDSSLVCCPYDSGLETVALSLDLVSGPHRFDGGPFPCGLFD